MRPDDFLPRLAGEFYRGQAVVFWTHTVDRRGTGWLDEHFHASFRELALHAAIRENLLCPIYTLMPDHLHLVWMGVGNNSDQRIATRFLRSFLADALAPNRWQHQPHDRVLRSEERKQNAFFAMVNYIAANPVRAGLVTVPENWRYTGCIVPGYPDLHPLGNGFWQKFWRLYETAVNRGSVGKWPLARHSPAV
jgi:putative transposase